MPSTICSKYIPLLGTKRRHELCKSYNHYSGSFVDLYNGRVTPENLYCTSLLSTIRLEPTAVRNATYCFTKSSFVLYLNLKFPGKHKLLLLLSTEKIKYYSIILVYASLKKVKRGLTYSFIKQQRRDKSTI